jgi:uncharacterized protein YndB with AHSA1/START domain
MGASNAKSEAAAGVADREVLITHVFDAPRDLVFRAWTDPEHLKRWFAPTGCTVHFARLDIRPGGAFHSCIRGPQGDCWCRGIYREVVAPERIVFTMAVADKDGNRIDPPAAGMDPDWPRETVVTVTFAERAGRTTLTLHQTVSEALAKRTGAHPSWISMLDRLAEGLAAA